MILSDFIGHRSFIQGNLQSEEDFYPYLGRRRRRVRNDESKAFNVYHFFDQILVFQTFENMTFLYLYIYKQPSKYNESDKKLFLIK